MAEPITLTEVKEYLRIDSEEEDTLLAGLILAAKEHCEAYLQAALPSEVPTPVKQALLILTGHFYEQRAGEDIPKVVYVLLSPYRAHLW
ncbi:head-tail connector protein [Anaeroselena agilis]|uniref:Head-tail connector protein n=1 Tax=Anaeroselena agilis TaxID=3063788 RepID=A0ABU3NTW7_9FIRM|nr:head-tail connector protein [Selenomonadales bacterium 4137-cl]